VGGEKALNPHPLTPLFGQRYRGEPQNKTRKSKRKNTHTGQYK